MKICIYVNIVSPHQIPLARELVALVGDENLRYVYTEQFHDERSKMGWNSETERWIVSVREQPDYARELIEGADVLLSGIRDCELFERRSKRGLVTLYMSERWFKPVPIMGHYIIDGRVRMLKKRFRSMGRRIKKLIEKDDKFYYLPIGLHAANDMAWVCGKDRIESFVSQPGGELRTKDGPVSKFFLWGYFVQPTIACKSDEPVSRSRPLRRVLWVGRLLALKRVDDIIKAVRKANLDLNDKEEKFTLDIYGSGPDEARLKKIAHDDCSISFHPPVAIDDVRLLMREHDIYVFSSNSFEGWGCVVNEALEEGMRVISTKEAGSGLTMLPSDCLYNAGDWTSLSKLLLTQLPLVGIGKWSPGFAAEQLLALASRIAMEK